MGTRHNNSEESLTTKEYEHTPSGYSMFTQCSFDAAKNHLDCYWGKNCIERFCKDLKEHTTKTITYGKRKMIPLSLMKSKKFVIYAKQNLILTTMMIIKSIKKSEIIVIILKNIEELLMIFVI